VVPVSNDCHTRVSFLGTPDDFFRAVELRKGYDDPFDAFGFEFEADDCGVTTAYFSFDYLVDPLFGYVLSRVVPSYPVGLSWLEPIGMRIGNLSFKDGRVIHLDERRGDAIYRWSEDSQLYQVLEIVYDDPEQAPYGEFCERLVSQEPLVQLRIAGVGDDSPPIGPSDGRNSRPSTNEGI